MVAGTLTWAGRATAERGQGEEREPTLGFSYVMILGFSQPSGCLGSHRPTATLQMQPDTPVSHDSVGWVAPTCFYIPFNELIPTPLCSFRCMLTGCSSLILFHGFYSHFFFSPYCLLTHAENPDFTSLNLSLIGDRAPNKGPVWTENS